MSKANLVLLAAGAFTFAERVYKYNKRRKAAKREELLKSEYVGYLQQKSLGYITTANNKGMSSEKAIDKALATTKAKAKELDVLDVYDAIDKKEWRLKLLCAWEKDEPAKGE